MKDWRKPAWWAVLLTVGGVVLFVALGFWQLRRADMKTQLLARFEHAAAQPEQSLADVLAEGVVPAVYPHVRVRGRLDGEHLYILDNQDRHGRPGVIVYAPMRVCADAPRCEGWRSHVLLVALGFLPRANGWRDLPDLPPVRGQLVTLTGLYAPPPGKGLELGGNALARQHEWPKVTTYLDLDQIANDLNLPLDGRVLLLDPDPATTYIRNWTPATMPPARHRAYALQWFTFALTAIVLFVVMHRKRRPDENDHGSNQRP